MSDEQITVLYLEDNEDWRKSIRKDLEKENIKAVTAASEKEFKDCVMRNSELADVVILDMDIEGSEATGAEIGHAAYEYQLQEHTAPKFIIFSDNKNNLCPQKALQLDAEHLKKDESEQLSFYVKSLALCKRLGLLDASAIEQIAKTSVDRTQALCRVIDKQILPHFEHCLGIPCAMIVEVDGNHYSVGAKLTSGTCKIIQQYLSVKPEPAGKVLTEEFFHALGIYGDEQQTLEEAHCITLVHPYAKLTLVLMGAN